MFYIGDDIRLIITVNEDISTATEISVFYQKPHCSDVIQTIVQPQTGLSGNEFAAAVGNEINLLNGTHGYSAMVIDNVITIAAPSGLGEAANAYVLSLLNINGVSVEIINFHGGDAVTDAVAEVTILDDVIYSGSIEVLSFEGTLPPVTLGAFEINYPLPSVPNSIITFDLPKVDNNVVGTWKFWVGVTDITGKFATSTEMAIEIVKHGTI